MEESKMRTKETAEQRHGIGLTARHSMLRCICTRLIVL
jgi:hypothetical protein